MALAAVVESIDTVPEALRAEYTEKEGKFYLNLDGLDNHHAVTGLTRALASERGMNADAKKKVAAWEKLGVSPEEIEKRLEVERKKAEELEIKAGNFDGVLAKKLGDQKLEYDGKISAADKAKQTALNVAREATIRSDLGASLVKAKATAEGMVALPKLIGDRVKIDFDDEGHISWKIMDREGRPMVGSRSDGLADYDDLVKDAIKVFPSLFGGSGGGGGAPQKGGGGNSADPVVTEADFNALSSKERSAKAAQPGFKIVG